MPTGSNAQLRNAVVAIALATIVAAGTWYLLQLHPSPDNASSGDANQRGAGATGDQPNTSRGNGHNVTSTTSPKHTAISASLPPPGAPLARIYDALKRRADGGDTEAATRLFHELHRCVAVLRTRRLLAEIPHDTDGNNSMVRDVRAGPAVEFKMLREMTDYVQSNSTRCEGATDAQLASFTPLMSQAAQLGDLKALDCYIGTDFDMMDGLLDHPEWIEQYRTQVPALVESALQRGDWVVVDLLHHAYSGAFDTSARGQLFGVDPVMDYRLLRLEQLGASGAFADKLAPMVTAAMKALSPAQATDAEAWASDYYSRYFNSASNEVLNGANICDITDD